MGHIDDDGSEEALGFESTEVSTAYALTPETHALWSAMSKCTPFRGRCAHSATDIQALLAVRTTSTPMVL